MGLTAMAAIGSASIVSCPAPPPGSVVVATVGGGVSATTYTCAGLTFSNFLVTDALNVPAGTSMALVSATFDNVLGIVNLGFNPNLTLQALVQDIHFSFQVTGGVSQIDAALGGSNSGMTERACSSTIDLQGGVCSGGLATQLAVITVNSGESVTSSLFARTSPLYIFKDINKGLNSELTSFSESFHTPVPEPMTLSMMGLGLLGLGLARRRQQGKK